MALSLLDKAEKALQRKRFAEVISLLQPHILEYDYSFRCFYLLATACLYQKDYKGARDYYKCARQIKPRDSDMLLGNAILFIRRNNIPAAIDCYLEILEYTPDCRQAKNALSYLRKLDTTESLTQMLENGKLYPFYPSISFRTQGILKRRFFVLMLCLFFSLSGIAFGGYHLYAKYGDHSVRADLSVISLCDDDYKNLVELGSSYQIILSEKDVTDLFFDAQRNFQKYDDNAAQLNINRLLLSNAASSIKRKARLLMSYFSEPGFDTVKTNFSYADVFRDPYLYLDCAVIWDGRATNVHVTDSATTFDFLIGYESRKKLEGVVPAVLFNSVMVDPDLPLTVLGRVSIQDKHLLLHVLSIHQPYQAQ